MKGIVTSEGLNLRFTPHADARILDQLKRGDLVIVLEVMRGGWLHVQATSGERGYVAQKYVKVEQEAPKSVLPPEPPRRLEKPDPVNRFLAWVFGLVTAAAGALVGWSHWGW
jgi:uncharacterized protein YgiM (DUF1202 family)